MNKRRATGEKKASLRKKRKYYQIYSSHSARTLHRPRCVFSGFTNKRRATAEKKASLRKKRQYFQIYSSDLMQQLVPMENKALFSHLSSRTLQNGDVYQKTLALVECSMFAALSGLVYFLSNSLAIENFFGCFFYLPIVISSMRWGIAGGRKTMVATTMLLLVLSGPVKALTYLLKHGIVGFTMGTLWRQAASQITPEMGVLAGGLRV